MTFMPPVPPQYDPEQIAALQADERRAASRSTPGTWIVAGLIAVAVVAWVLMVVTHSR